MKFGWRSAIFALVVGGALAPARADELRVAASSATAFNASAYIAKEKGFFDKEGLKVTLQDVGGGTNVVASLVGGSADIGMLGMGNLVQARTRGQNLKAFATATRGFPNYVVVNKKFKQESGLGEGTPIVERIKSLKGKIVGVNDVGGSAGDFVRELLRRAGLKDDDVTIINIPNAAGRLAALKAGRIDAAIAYSPEPETAAVEGYGETYIDALKDLPETQGVEWLLFVAKADYIENNKESLRKFVAALGAVGQLIEQTPKEAQAAYFAQLTAKSRGAALDPKVQDLVWQSMLGYIARPATLQPEAVAKSRTYFSISDAITTEALTDFTIGSAPAK